MSARCRRIAVLVCTGVLLLGGCGGASTPAQEVPELADTLTAIDEALAEEHYLSARRHLRQLVDTVEAARNSGELVRQGSMRAGNNKPRPPRMPGGPTTAGSQADVPHVPC